jgi:hypothetical protein
MADSDMLADESILDGSVAISSRNSEMTTDIAWQNALASVLSVRMSDWEGDQRVSKAYL